jgi:hypothetical protein
MGNGEHTLGLDVAMHNTRIVEIGETLQHLKCVYHDDGFVFNATVLEQAG